MVGFWIRDMELTSSFGVFGNIIVVDVIMHLR